MATLLASSPQTPFPICRSSAHLSRQPPCSRDTEIIAQNSRLNALHLCLLSTTTRALGPALGSSHWPGRGCPGTTDGARFAGAGAPSRRRIRFCFPASSALHMSLPRLLSPSSCASLSPLPHLLLLTCVGGGAWEGGGLGVLERAAGRIAWDLQEASLGSCDFTLTWPVSHGRPQAQLCPTGPSGLA